MSGFTTPSKWKLWRPSNGIIFAGAGDGNESRQPQPFLQVDLSRRLHGDNVGKAVQVDANLERGLVLPVSNHETAVVSGEETRSMSLEVAGKEPAGELQKVEDKDKEEEKEEDLTPPATTLDFKIPESAFRAAKRAAPGTPESFWSYTLYRGPADEKVKVHYCRSLHTTERVCQQYFLDEKMLGFDLEWVPEATKLQGARRNVCLLQLASQSRIALIHIALYPSKDELVAPSLRKIMEDPAITKAGVFIKGDCTRLRNFLGIESRGTFELSHLYKLVRYSRTGELHMINKKLVSLATQVQDCLHLPMFKGQDVRSSNWSQPLRLDQIIYSASDAYAAVQLFAVLEHQRESLKPTPPRPRHAELDLPIQLADGASIVAPDEPAEEDQVKGEDKVPTTLPSEFLNTAGQDIQIEAESETPDEEAPESKPQSNRKPPPVAAAPSPPPKVKDERIAAAETWLVRYRTTNPKLRAQPSALRAYHIWYGNEGLDPVAIASLLRQPPLQTTTVVSYILEAIKLEKLPYHKVRLRTEVLRLLPQQVLEMRYRSLAKACEYEEAAAEQA